MPWNDWQFWLATAGALVALGFVLRPLLSRRGGPECGGCGPNPSARPKRTPLTISGTRDNQHTPG